MKHASVLILSFFLSFAAHAKEEAALIVNEMDSSEAESKDDSKAPYESDSKVFSDAYEKADQIVSIAKRKERVALELNNIGGYYLYTEKQLDHAQYFYQRSYELFEQIGNVYGIAMTTYNQGVVLRAQKDIVAACEKTLEALPIAEEAAGKKRYNKKLSAALVETIKKFNKINCGSGT